MQWIRCELLNESWYHYKSAGYWNNSIKSKALIKCRASDQRKKTAHNLRCKFSSVLLNRRIGSVAENLSSIDMFTRFLDASNDKLESKSKTLVTGVDYWISRVALSLNPFVCNSETKNGVITDLKKNKFLMLMLSHAYVLALAFKDEGPIRSCLSHRRST